MNNHDHDPANAERNEAVHVTAAASTQPFFEQLVEFFRRNALHFLIAGLILLIVQDVFGTHGVLAMRRSQVEAKQIQQDITQLNDENKRLDQEAKALNNDPAAVECQARAIGLARPGEVVFRLAPKSEDTAKHVAPCENAPTAKH